MNANDDQPTIFNILSDEIRATVEANCPGFYDRKETQAKKYNFLGSKYVSGRDVADTAKLIRQDLKAAYPALKISVRISRYSMGRSIDIEIDRVPFQVTNAKRVENDTLRPHAFYSSTIEPLYTPEALGLLKAVEAIAKAYWYDNSDSQSDFFDSAFHLDVKFNWRRAGAERDAIEKLVKAGCRNVRLKQLQPA